jgi:hypothetical protein
MQASGITE